jgi:hypothetical protein
MKVRGDQQSATHDSQSEIDGQQNKPSQASDAKQDPVATGNKFQYALLNFHLDGIFLSETELP